MSNVLHVNSSEFNDVVANNDLVFVDFFATWCGPDVYKRQGCHTIWNKSIIN